MTEKTDSFQNVPGIGYKLHTNCRVCGSPDLTKYLDLGMMPLPNNLFVSSGLAKNANRFPLEVMLCEQCGLSQLSVVIDPKEMFSYYTYRSSINAGYVKHCREMAVQLKEKYMLNHRSFVIDVASNDAALLIQFKEEIKCKVLGVDPAKNLCQIAEEKGISSVARFWNTDLVKDMFSTFGKADIITATNVFAHVDDVEGFLHTSKQLLNPGGVFILEFPYIIDFIEGKEIDTVYSEHLSYFSITPLVYLCGQLGLKVISVEKFKIHGGTVRVSISHSESELNIEESVQSFMLAEIFGGYHKIAKYKEWAIDCQEMIIDFRGWLLSLKEQGKRVWAFAASAKGNTLLNCANITTEQIEFIIDETPEKIGQYSPGTGIMIKGMDTLIEYQPDYLVVLSWNFADSIMEKCRQKGYKGKFIIPIPEFKIIE